MTTETFSRPISTVPGLLSELGRAFAAIAAGMQAARDYQRYRSATDAALAREGIARQDIARLVFERNFRVVP